MKSELIPLNGDAPIPITRDVTLIGRREYCDVIVSHPSLSKRHCVLVRTDGLLIVRDLISTNGTKVNGQRVMWAALLPNDRLTIGRVKFRVYLGPDDSLSPSELGRRGSAAPTTGGGAAGVGAAAAAAIAAAVANGDGRPKPGGPGHDDPFVTRAPTGFAAPSPLSMPALSSPPPRRPAEPDGELEILDDESGLEILDDEGEEPFVLELE